MRRLGRLPEFPDVGACDERFAFAAKDDRADRCVGLRGPKCREQAAAYRVRQRVDWWTVDRDDRDITLGPQRDGRRRLISQISALPRRFQRDEQVAFWFTRIMSIARRATRRGPATSVSARRGPRPARRGRP